MQQYYLHSEFITNSARRNVSSISIHNKQLLCMTNQNCLEIYQYTANGIRLYSRQHFNCTISKIQVLPSKHVNIGDYIFIVDKKGRYAFWRSGGQLQFIEDNQIEMSKSLYKSNDIEQQEVSFSGQMHYFDVHDTKGSIFFAINHRITLIDFSITRLGIKIDKTKKIEIPYVQYRFIDWVKNKKNTKLLGIIEEIQQKTIMKVHSLNNNKLTEQNLVYQHQKINLEQFISNNDQLLLLTQDQVMTLSISKSFAHLYTYNIHNESGKIISIKDQLFCYIGEELILFTSDKFKSYGSLLYDSSNLFEGKGILEGSYLLTLEDGGNLISATTFNNQTYFIIIYQNTWKMFHQIKGLTAIYSLHPTSNTNSIVAVMDDSIDKYQIAVIQKLKVSPLTNQQRYQYLIEALFCVNKGEYIVMVSKQANSLMKYDEETKQFSFLFELPQQKILAISCNILVTDSSIYAIDLQNQACQPIVKQEIVLACLNQSSVLFLSSSGQVKKLNLELNETTVVRKDAYDEYVWHLLPSNNLITAKMSQTGKLYVWSEDQLFQEIILQQQTIISAIQMFQLQNDNIIESFVAVGFINGHLHIYSASGQLAASFTEHSSQPVNFFLINNKLLGVTSGQRQYILSFEQKLKLTPIQFSSESNKPKSIVFLPHISSFLFTENGQEQSGNLTRMISLDNLAQIHQNIRIEETYRVKAITNKMAQIPTIFIHNGLILVGISSQLLIYDQLSGRLIKTLQHYLKDVIGMFMLQCGFIVYGIDSIERNLIYNYSLPNYQEIGWTNFILKDNKYIKTIRQIENSNNFICRGEKYTTLYEFNSPKDYTEIAELKTDLPGYSLQISSEHHIITETDSNRLVNAYIYGQKILPISRYIADNEINDHLIMHRSIVYGDKNGSVGILQLNTQNVNQSLKMLMTKVGSINFSSEVTALARITKEKAYFGTASGQIGIIQLIDEPTFNTLKKAQQLIYNQSAKSCDLNYQIWRNRQPANDKLIDCALIQKYLDFYLHKNANGQQSMYQNVSQIMKHIEK